MSIAFLITTCNRQESCQRLVNSIRSIGTVYVFNDGGQYGIFGAVNGSHPRRLGKRGYWKTVNHLFWMRSHHDYYIMLPDDFMMTPEQVEQAIKTWQGIDDPRKICLNLYADRKGLMCWTGFKPVDKEETWLTQWVDMCFICQDKFFTVLGNIPEPTFRSKSSGVGAFISRFFHKKKFTMYQVKESLVTPQPEHLKTQMHDDNRWRSNPKEPRRVI